MTTMESANHDSLQDLYEQELLHTQTDDGEISVAVTRDIADEEDRMALWGMIETGFAALNSRSFELQSMAFDEFIEDVSRADVLKYVARDESGIPIGYMTAHIDMDNISWVNRDLLQAQQDGVDRGADSFFIGTLVVSPERRGSEAIPTLIHAALQHFRDMNAASGRNALCFFDCAQANYPWLAEYVKSLSEPSGDFPGVPVEIRGIGTEYWAEDLTAESLSASGHVVRKLAYLSQAEEGMYKILDAQYIYAMQLVDPEQNPS